MAEYQKALFNRKDQSTDSLKVKLWKMLSWRLNSMGPPKCIDEWKRCFIGLKAVTKAKFLKFQNKLGRKVALSRLTTTEAAIIEMCAIIPDETTAEAASNTMCNVDLIDVSNSQTMPGEIPNETTSETNSNTMCNMDMMIADSQGSFSSMGVDSQHEVLFVDRSQDEVSFNSPNAIVGPSSTITSGAYLSMIQAAKSQEELLSAVQVPMEEEFEEASHSSNQQLDSDNALTDMVKFIAPLPEDSGSYANLSQKQKLVELVADNYSALFGRISTQLNAGLLKNKLWILITRQLNKMGPTKNVKGWTDCFAALKGKTKEKLTLIRQHKNRTKGRIPANANLNEIDAKIIKMCTLTVLDGSSVLNEVGLRPNLITNQNGTNNRIARVTTELEQLSNQAPDPIFEISVGERDVSTPIISFEELATETERNDSIAPVRSLSPSLQTEIQNDNSPHPSQRNRLRLQLHLPKNHDQQSQSPQLHQPQPQNPPQKRSTKNRTPQKKALQNRQPKNRPPKKRPSQPQSLTLDEIRQILEPRPQRRGIEVNLNRSIDPLRVENHEPIADVIPPHPRRNRLSTPLGVMAAESLQLQQQNNTFLQDILLELKYTNRH